MLTIADLFLFMGQSNMAGRGVVCEKWPQAAPQIIPGAAYEFRAISNPSRLYPVTEPFGIHENRKDGICDVFPGDNEKQFILAKTGSCVTSFCNACYQKTQVPLIAISASKGGSTISQWQLDSKEAYLPDAISRFQTAKSYLLSHGCHIRHQFLVWCQGESDGDIGTSSRDYQQMFISFLNPLRENGIEKCFLIKTGYSNHHADDAINQPLWDRQYLEIQNAQEQLVKTQPDVVIVSRLLPSMRQRGLMKDAFHYYQQAYNECGEEAGRRAADNITKNIKGENIK